jgi:hypothetical protein
MIFLKGYARRVKKSFNALHDPQVSQWREARAIAHATGSARH